MQPLEEHLSALWEAGHRKRDEEIGENRAALVRRVRAELNAIVSSVRISLSHEQSEMEEQCKRLLSMADKLTTDVDAWYAKASSSIDALDEEQKGLQKLVRQVEDRVAAKSDELKKQQEQRVQDVRAAFVQRFKDVEAEL
uniref:Uncharacterized protein n=1 Tax=Trypanosoma congolense (strain IL3000) TaxID=1068625 RepID=G0UZ90_TRYCI|nr:conserved hypothetical protein [Trypanosoma congolense IL3000]